MSGSGIVRAKKPPTAKTFQKATIASRYKPDVYKMAKQERVAAGFEGLFNVDAGPMLVVPLAQTENLLTLRVYTQADVDGEDRTAPLKHGLKALGITPRVKSNEGVVEFNLVRADLSLKLFGMRTEEQPHEYVLHRVARNILGPQEIRRAILGLSLTEPAPVSSTP